MTTQSTKEIKIRLSEQLLSRLDAAAERNGRSRNAEATARFERNLMDESVQPADRALAAFASELTARVAGQGLLGVLDPEYRGDELATLKGALCALLDELGATDDPKAMELGANVGKRFVLDARLAMAKEPSRRSAMDETLAEAAKAWGLKP